MYIMQKNPIHAYIFLFIGVSNFKSLVSVILPKHYQARSTETSLTLLFVKADQIFRHNWEKSPLFIFSRELFTNVNSMQVFGLFLWTEMRLPSVCTQIGFCFFMSNSTRKWLPRVIKLSVLCQALYIFVLLNMIMGQQHNLAHLTAKKHNTSPPFPILTFHLSYVIFFSISTFSFSLSTSTSSSSFWNSV